MRKYKLSIVVPTYNGGGWIEDTLESVLCQLVNYRDEVELVVRDNCSTDNTPQIVEKLNDKYNNLIKYDRRSETCIADVNFREAVALSDGEYMVILGDDDLFYPCFLHYVLSLIDKHPEVGMFYFNRIGTSREYEGASLSDNKLNAYFYKYYNNPDDFASDYSMQASFTSVDVIKRDCFEKGLPFAKSIYYGVEWYSVMLYGLQQMPCMALYSPMVLQRAPKVRYWSDRMLLYVIIGVDNMFSDLQSYYPKTYQDWQSRKEKEIPVYKYIISCIPLNRKLYLSKKDELLDKLNPLQKALALFLIHTSLFDRVIVMIIKLLRSIKSKI